ncbi:MAG: hypothetical protein ABI852_12035 [Gemmatimonadaceae bacterium]
MNRLKPTVLANNLFRNNMMIGSALTSGMIRSSVLASLALLMVACSSNTAATEPTPSNNDSQHGIVAGTLEVTTSNNTVKLRNTTERQVGYMVIEKNQVTVAMFPPCVSNCQVLKQAESATVPFTQIVGYTPQATDATVLWWKYAIRTDGTLVPEGSMQSTSIKLK